jgi:hypothetical protein
MYCEVTIKESETREKGLYKAEAKYIKNNYKGRYSYKLESAMARLRVIIFFLKSGGNTYSSPTFRTRLFSVDRSGDIMLPRSSYKIFNKKDVTFDKSNSNNLLDEFPVEIKNRKLENQFNAEYVFSEASINYEDKLFEIRYFNINKIFDDAKSKKFVIDKLENINIIPNIKFENNKNTEIFKTEIKIKSRNYLNITKYNDFITCMEISIIPKKTYELTVELPSKMVYYIKMALIMLICVVLWIYLLIFIQSIYKQYGQSFFKICVMPMVSVLCIKMLITANLMIFISTFLAYFFGKRIYIQNKLTIYGLIYRALVPVIAINHHKSIIMYLKLYKEL